VTFDVVLVGADQSSWHILTGAEGVMIGGGFGGLDFPTYAQQVFSTAHQAGRTYRGTRYDARKLPITLHVGDMWATARTDDTWRDLDAQFRAALSPEQLQKLIIVSNHGYRWWDVRLDEYVPTAVATDPGLQGLNTYNAVFVADNPFPQGFGFSAPVPLGGVTAYNGGDIDGWPVWTVRGPVAGTVTVTVGSGVQTTTLPPLSVGQSLFFDTDPTKRSIVDQNGVSRRGELTARDLRASVPANSSRAFSWSATGYGANPMAVQLDVPFRYRSAW